MPNALDTAAPHTRKVSIASPSPMSPSGGRRSTQLGRTSNAGGPRPSVEFDKRFDGPFGRPSITMVRRRSSQLTPHGVRKASAADNPAGFTGMEGEKSPEDGAATTAAERAGVDFDPNAIALQSSDSAFEPEPPPLGYTLRTRKLAITFFWSLIVFDSIVMPIALYFGLWYGVGPGASEGMHKLSANTVWSIITAALGGASIIEYFVRFWRLFRHNSTCRVIGGRRMYLDFFHWNFTIAWVIVMVELIVGSVQDWPPIRLLSMPVPTMGWVFGTELLILDFMRWREMPCPLRVSSMPRGTQVRPGIYSLIEDICAVDGSGGTAFREALNTRYEASHVFRAMLRRLGLFWSIGGEAMATVCTILIFTIGGDAAFVVGWAVPFIWAGIWTLCTFWYVARELKHEKIAWAEEAAAKSAA
ncbi:hypothetical protein K431DRAFT_317569 [Polychaeton citri CBS 116435]|uniref:Uncharacterized protein n=1 Tax=Polychaeton citri CBS 116435 TaxID=1314669 RepID=A0A9P4UUY0_9PEZI|nr:hypothetical protein K431DRAFT_317569 [Polychaeton citri CBS 116435]